MTSMPASRRARAMIFAPRSWPSRPGFAMTTRIFLATRAILRADARERQPPLHVPRQLARRFAAERDGLVGAAGNRYACGADDVAQRDAHRSELRRARQLAPRRRSG